MFTQLRKFKFIWLTRPGVSRYNKFRSLAGQASFSYADMAELADALDLGSSGRPCRFESCYPHQIMMIRTRFPSGTASDFWYIFSTQAKAAVSGVMPPLLSTLQTGCYKAVRKSPFSPAAPHAAPVRSHSRPSSPESHPPPGWWKACGPR